MKVLATLTLVLGCFANAVLAEDVPVKEPPKPPGLVDRLAKVLKGDEAPFTIVTKVYIRAGSEDEFEKVAARASKASAAEPGCTVYEFHRDMEKPTNYTLIETWSGLNAIKAHLKQDHTKEIQTAMTEMGTTPRTTEIFATTLGR